MYPEQICKFAAVKKKFPADSGLTVVLDLSTARTRPSVRSESVDGSGHLLDGKAQEHGVRHKMLTKGLTEAVRFTVKLAKLEHHD